MYLRENRYNTLYKNVDSGIKCYAVISDIQQESQYYYKFKVKVKRVNNEEKYNNSEILLLVKKNKNRELYNFEYGDLICFSGEFSMPEHSRNYGCFDYANFLKTQNVYAICACGIEDVNVVQKKILQVHRY